MPKKVEEKKIAAPDAVAPELNQSETSQFSNTLQTSATDAIKSEDSATSALSVEDASTPADALSESSNPKPEHLLVTETMEDEKFSSRLEELNSRLTSESGGTENSEAEGDYAFDFGEPPLHLLLPELRKYIDRERLRLSGGATMHGSLLERKFQSFATECDNLLKFLVDHGYTK